MSKFAWIKISVIGALWTIISIAAVSGYLIGKGDAARQITDLKQRLAVSSAPKQGCGAEVELIEARTGRHNVFGMALGGLLPTAPRHLHLREMLTSR